MFNRWHAIVQQPLNLLADKDAMKSANSVWSTNGEVRLTQGVPEISLTSEPGVGG